MRREFFCNWSAPACSCGTSSSGRSNLQGADELDQRLGARRDGALFPVGDHAALATGAIRELLLSQPGAEAGFPDYISAPHGVDSTPDHIPFFVSDMIQ